VTNRWRVATAPWLGPFHTLSTMILKLEQRSPESVPYLHETDTLFVLSDYGGEQKHAGYHVLTFLVVDPRSFASWDAEWQPARRRFLRDGRRMAFKAMNDSHRSNAITSFLRAANRLSGVVFSLAISHAIKDFFAPNGEISPEIASISLRWKKRPLEKFLISSGIVSLLVGGLSRPLQNIVWITDEDQIAANEQRYYDACALFQFTSGHFISHNLGHFRFGTSRSDDGTRRIEDLLAIPDMVAGCLDEMLTKYQAIGPPSMAVMRALPDTLSPKSRLLANWIAWEHSQLKRIVFTIDTLPDSKALRYSHFKVAGFEVKNP